MVMVRSLKNKMTVKQRELDYNINRRNWLYRIGLQETWRISWIAEYGHTLEGSFKNDF